MPYICPYCRSAAVWSQDVDAADLARAIADVKLRPKVRALLAALLAASPHFISPKALMQILYPDRNQPEMPSAHVVKVFACHLRKALSETPYRIVSEYGRGYALVREPVSGASELLAQYQGL